MPKDLLSSSAIFSAKRKRLSDLIGHIHAVFIWRHFILGVCQPQKHEVGVKWLPSMYSNPSATGSRLITKIGNCRANEQTQCLSILHLQDFRTRQTSLQRLATGQKPDELVIYLVSAICWQFNMDSCAEVFSNEVRRCQTASNYWREMACTLSIVSVHPTIVRKEQTV